MIEKADIDTIMCSYVALNVDEIKTLFVLIGIINSKLNEVIDAVNGEEK